MGCECKPESCAVDVALGGETHGLEICHARAVYRRHQDLQFSCRALCSWPEVLD